MTSPTFSSIREFVARFHPEPDPTPSEAARALGAVARANARAKSQRLHAQLRAEVAAGVVATLITPCGHGLPPRQFSARRASSAVRVFRLGTLAAFKEHGITRTRQTSSMAGQSSELW